jgi:hypothetical protein
VGVRTRTSHFWNKLKSNARERGKELGLTRAQAEWLVQQSCLYCDASPEFV